MRRLWILVPFWAFFLAYLVFFAYRHHAEQASLAAALPVTVPEPPAPSAPDAIPEAPTSPAPPKREPESLAPTVSESELASRLRAVAAEVFVLPRAAPSAPVSFLWPVDAEGSPDQPELLALASRASFPRWKLHEDEWLGFYYPDDPTITLEILEGAAPFPMLGETMWTVADAPQRRYRLATPDGATFALISLEKTADFDETPRFPKPEVFHRVWVGKGSLCRASLMGDGHLRRLEVLSGGERASVLDWPHCAVHREVYERLALSLFLKGPLADGENLLAARWSGADFPERLGFLAPGADLAAITALLGPPSGREGDVLLYDQSPGETDEVATVFRVPVADGRFQGFSQGWRTRRREAPEAGSFAWMLEKTGGTSGDAGTVGYDLGPLTDEEALALFERFCAEAPTADAEAWDTWCRVLANLAEMGVRDERVPSHLGARFLDPSLPQGNATQVLHAYDPAVGRDLFAARLRALLSPEKSAPAGPDLAHDVQVLFSYLGREDERSAPLLDLALRSGDEAVRAAGHVFRDWLPAGPAAAFLERGLADSSLTIRRRCAEALCGENEVPTRLLALVAERLATEDDPQTRTYLEEARRLHTAAETEAVQAPASGNPPADTSS